MDFPYVNLSGFQPVVSHRTGQLILCCLEECPNIGTDTIQLVTKDKAGTGHATWIFCSEAHRDEFRRRSTT